MAMGEGDGIGGRLVIAVGVGGIVGEGGMEPPKCLVSFICAVTMIHCLMNLKKGVFSAGHFEDELVGETLI